MEELNILFITADQLRGDSLQCAGHHLLETPHLDALFADGVRFAQHFTTASPCAPARASIHTGMYLSNHRVISNGTPLDERASNWALEIAEATDVQPALVGYTDLPPDPRTLVGVGSKGVQRWDGGFLPGLRNLSEHNEMGSPAWLTAHGVELGPVMDMIKAPGYVPWNGWTGETHWLEVAKGQASREDAEPLADGFPAPAAYAKEASDTYVLTSQAIEHVLTESNAGRRWALHLSLLKPHPPLIAPEPYNKKYHPGKVRAPVRPLDDAAAEAKVHPYLACLHDKDTLRPLVQGETGTVKDVTDEELRLLTSSYYGLISELDDNIGRLVEGLKVAGQLEKTLIVFTADHGEMLGDHWLRGKLGFYDGAYHIPLLVRDPRPEADASRGSSVASFTEHVDIAPTLLDYFGVPVPRQCDGRSLRPFVEAAARAPPPPGWRRAVHWEHDFRFGVGEVLRGSHGLDMNDCSLTVLRTASRKLVHFGGDLPPLLYDLAKDPEEGHDVSGDPFYARDLAVLQGQMLSWRLRHCSQVLTHLRVGVGRPLTVYDSTTSRADEASPKHMLPSAFSARAAKRMRGGGSC